MGVKMNKISTEINKLLKETKIKIAENQKNETIILLDFVNGYNKIRSEFRNDQKN